MSVTKTKTFKNGNGIALQLPKGLGILPDEMFRIMRDGDTLTARRIPSPEEEVERLRRFREMIAELGEMVSPGEIEERVLIEFPHRPGLF